MEKIIQRINELANKHKTVGLTAEEVEEREQLRQKYLATFRRNFRQQLDQIEIVDGDDQGIVH